MSDQVVFTVSRRFEDCNIGLFYIGSKEKTEASTIRLQT